MADTAAITRKIEALQRHIADCRAELVSLEVRRAKIAARGEWWENADRLDVCPKCGRYLKVHDFHRGAPECVVPLAME
jgi:predicted  nucleic acid-binding Zn-ribbon protein